MYTEDGLLAYGSHVRVIEVVELSLISANGSFKVDSADTVVSDDSTFLSLIIFKAMEIEK